MRIASFLDRNDVTAAVPASGKQEVMTALVDLLTSNHDQLDHDVLLSVLLKREELRSTGIEEGVAFPHGRVPGLKSLLSCFGRCRKGVDFDSFDGKPTHFFFVLLIPEEAEGSHLKLVLYGSPGHGPTMPSTAHSMVVNSNSDIRNPCGTRRFSLRS